MINNLLWKIGWLLVTRQELTELYEAIRGVANETRNLRRAKLELDAAVEHYESRRKEMDSVRQRIVLIWKRGDISQGTAAWLMDISEDELITGWTPPPAGEKGRAS